MSGAVTAAVVGAAITAGVSMYTANKQEQAQEDAMKQQEKLAAEAQEREEALMTNAAQQEATATVDYGTELEEDEEISEGFNEFVAAKPSLGSTKKASTGLGFGV